MLIYNKSGKLLLEIEGDTLTNADLRWANLRGANLRGHNVRRD